MQKHYIKDQTNMKILKIISTEKAMERFMTAANNGNKGTLQEE